MKKILCTLTAFIFLFCTACAEGNIIEKPEIIIEMITPSPSPEPMGETYSTEDMIVTLPVGMTILDGAERLGYDAALNFDYPAGGTLLLLAMDEDAGAVLSFSLLESTLDATSAAHDAALAIPFASVKEVTLGENSFSVLSCTTEGETFRLFFLSDGNRLLCVGASGLEEDEINTMLTGLIF